MSDRGPGIEEGLEERIFEPFFSGKGSTGLGLSTCRAIIEHHNGTIRAANRPGGGAMFSIRIPEASTIEGSNWQSPEEDSPPKFDADRELTKG